MQHGKAQEVRYHDRQDEDWIFAEENERPGYQRRELPWGGLHHARIALRDMAIAGRENKCGGLSALAGRDDPSLELIGNNKEKSRSRSSACGEG
jgi:hypothetical protein